MTTFQIKLLAIIMMVVDHVGVFLFPNLIIFRIIGRLSFPLFAWLIANGAYHSKNKNKYQIRLFIFALLSQIPFMLLYGETNFYPLHLNIFFTLSLGLLAIQLMGKTKNKILYLVIITFCTLAAKFLNTDYGATGVLSIIAFYIFFANLQMTIISQVVIYTVFLALTSPNLILLQNTTAPIYLIEPIGLFSLIFIAMYNQKEGRKTKYLFYWFYPLHLLLIYLVKITLLKGL